MSKLGVKTMIKDLQKYATAAFLKLEQGNSGIACSNYQNFIRERR